MNRTTTMIHFSPSGTTARTANLIAANISDSVQSIDLLKDKPKMEKHFSSNDIVVVAMPVFAGRLPGICADMLGMLKGDRTPAIAAVVYGNRAYEDALLELTDILKENGFIVVGAGAMVAQHSIFPNVAKGRPDESDIEMIRGFAARCAAVIESSKTGSLPVPGNRPYRETGGGLPIAVSAGSSCNACGACGKICPVGAIPVDELRKTDKEKCINCTACISICPQKARKYRGMKYWLGGKAFGKKCSTRLEPEFYVLDNSGAQI